MEKPRLLILGGCGFIGRNLVSFLITNDLVSAIRIVDKVPPQVAWLNEQNQKCFQNPLVEFKSANLINPESCKNAFTCPDNKWDFVVNCAGETKLGQTDPVYEEGILKLSVNCAKEASLHQVKHYVELSSGKMNSSEKVPHKENSPVEPWSYIGKWKFQVEQQLRALDLNYSILRLATVYGVGDRLGLTPRIIVASIYKHLGETMKLLWNADLRINTVHVVDVCRAIWFICNRDDTIGEIYNVVDEADSTQGSLSNLLSDLFDIKVDFCGNIASSVVDLEGVADDANDKHLVPWAEVCRTDNIQNTPLTPHMDPELLLHKHLRLDGTKLKKLGFEISIPSPTTDNLRAIIDDYVQMKVFPFSLAP